MKALVCGSRFKPGEFTEDVRTRAREETERIVASLPKNATLIVGGALGVDTWAEQAAMRRKDLRVLVFLPECNDPRTGRYNPQAGKTRNLKMLGERPGVVHAVWDGKSTGTKHTIRAAQARGITVNCTVVNEDSWSGEEPDV